MKINYYHQESVLHKISIGYKIIILLLYILITIIIPPIGLIMMFLLANLFLLIAKYEILQYHVTQYNYLFFLISVILVTISLQADLYVMIIILGKIYILMMLINTYRMTTSILQNIFLIQKIAGFFKIASASKVFNYLLLIFITRNSYKQYYKIQKEKLMHSGMEFKFYNLSNHWKLISIILDNSENILIEIEKNLAIRDFNLTREEVFAKMILFEAVDKIKFIIALGALIVLLLGELGYEILVNY